VNRETTPLKNLSNQNKFLTSGATASHHKLSGNQQNILSSDERKKLFNTFMKEMTSSMHSTNNPNSGNHTGTTAGGKKSKKHADAHNQMRVVSTSSSRPRS